MNLLIPCQVSDKATPYHATPSTLSCRVLCERRECIARALFFKKSVQLLAYADDIDIIGRTKRDVTATFSATEQESTKMGLAVNEVKTQYILSTNGEVRLIDSQIKVDKYTFNIVKEFIYLGSVIITKNDFSLEIKRRITFANSYFYGLNRQFSNSGRSCTTKLIFYKKLIVPVLLYDAEAWT